MTVRRGLAPVLIVLLLASPGAAQAHLTVTGLGPVYDGLAHVLLSPEDLIPVIALGFLAGLAGARPSRRLLAILPAAWATGGLAALAGLTPPPVTLVAASAGLCLAIGGLLAAGVRKPSWPGCLAALLLGLVRGLADLAGVDATLAHGAGALAMAAGVAAVFVLAASLTLPLRRSWLVIAARVSGSWLAAFGLLLAGWLLRYGSRIT